MHPTSAFILAVHTCQDSACCCGGVARKNTKLLGVSDCTSELEITTYVLRSLFLVIAMMKIFVVKSNDIYSLHSMENKHWIFISQILLTQVI
jgi:hypothetical protein